MLSEPFWRASAQCRRDHAEHFFSPSHLERKDEKTAREGQARALCRVCPVLEECRAHALAVQEPHGIWGGLNELERRRVIRARQAELEASA